MQFPLNVTATLDKAGTFKTLKKALQDTNLLETVEKSQKITIFAPTDEAFAKIKSLPSGNDLANVLKYHVVPAVAYSTDFDKTTTVPSLLSEKKTIKVEPKDGKVFVNGIQVVKADVAIANGVVSHHILKLFS